MQVELDSEPITPKTAEEAESFRKWQLYSSAHCNLSVVKAMVGDGRVRATASVFNGARDLGIKVKLLKVLDRHPDLLGEVRAA
jgi:hypothetical protein